MKIKSALFSVGLFSLAGYLFYQYGLSDEAKYAVGQTAATIKGAYENINEMLQEMQGHAAEAYPQANVEKTKNEWAEIGY